MDKTEFLKEILAKGKKLKETADESEILKADEGCKIMLQLSEKIVDVILNDDIIKDDMEDWALTILLALGRATAIMLEGLDHVHATGFMPAEIMYTKIVLPASLGIIHLGIIQSHVEERAKTKSQEEEDGKGDS